MIKNIYEMLSVDWYFKTGKIAIKDDVTYTYNALLEDVNDMAEFLLSMNLSRNSRIGLHLPNGYKFVVALLACNKVGCVVLPINYKCSLASLLHIVEDSKMKLIITDEFHGHQKRYSQSAIKEEVWNNFYIYLFSEIEHSDKQEFMCNSKDIALIIYTSGSVGNPKGVLLSNQNLILATKIISSYLHSCNDDIILSILPFCFSYGLTQLLISLFTSATIIIRNNYLLREIPFLLDSEKITGCAGVASFWSNLIKEKNIGKYEYASLKYITNAGEGLPVKYHDVLRNIFKDKRIYLMYGMTECIRCSFLEPEMFEIKKGSIGKAIYDSEIYVVDDNNEICMPNDVGEFVFRGSTVAQGYLNEDLVNCKTFRRNPFNDLYNEKVVYTGDMGYQDEDGFLFYIGRKDNRFKNKGFRINGSEISNKLMELMFVEECCVVARSEDDDTMQIVAYLKIKKTINKNEAEKTLFSFVKRELPIYMQVDKVFFLEEIPKLYCGKYDYKKLKNDPIYQLDD